MKLSEALLLYHDSDDESENKEICLISKEPIINKLTLPCGHSFEYQCIKKEFSYQINNYIPTKCPYCRKEYHRLILPYYELKEPSLVIYNEDNNSEIDYSKYEAIYNSIKLYSSYKLIDCFKCEYSFKTGKNKGCLGNAIANHFKFGNYCSKHFKKYIESKIKEKTKKITKKNKKTINQETQCKAITAKGVQCSRSINFSIEGNMQYCKCHYLKNNS